MGVIFNDSIKEFEDLILTSDYMKIAHMSDQEAIDILRSLLKNSGIILGRGNGKTTQTLKLVRVISKGMEALKERSFKNGD